MHHRIDRFVVRFFAVLLILAVAIALPSFLEARQRSKQKQTMVTLRDLGTRIEAGHAVTGGRDGWGHPLQIRRTKWHYSIRAAGSDGRFETTATRGAVKTYADDLVLIDGGFAQFPEGI